MNVREWFELEKKTDGLYRCRGGHLADILLLSGGIAYCFILWIGSGLGYLLYRLKIIRWTAYYNIKRK